MGGLEGTDFGNYRLLKHIASGVCYEVYRAHRQGIGAHPVAVTVLSNRTPLSPAPPPGASVVAAFLREVELLASARLPSMLPIYECGVCDDFPFLVTPYVGDGWLTAMPSGGLPRLQPDVVANVIYDLAETLQIAHDHDVMHGHVSPGTVLIASVQTAPLGAPLAPSQQAWSGSVPRAGSAATRPTAILTGFGMSSLLARWLPSADPHRVSRYTAPEHFAGQFTPWGDQFALACLAYTLITGRPAPEATGAEELGGVPGAAPYQSGRLPADLSAATHAVLARALSRDPALRFPSVRVFAAAFLATLEAPRAPFAQSAPPSTAARPPSTRPDRGSRQPWAGAVASATQGTAVSRDTRPARASATPRVRPPSGYQECADARGGVARRDGRRGPEPATRRASKRSVAAAVAERLALVAVLAIAVVGAHAVRSLAQVRNRPPVVAPLRVAVMQVSANGTVDFRTLVTGTSPNANAPMLAPRMAWSSAQSAAIAQAAAHIPALPPLAETAPTLGTGDWTSVPTGGAVPLRHRLGLGQSAIGSPEPAGVSVGSNQSFVIEAVGASFSIFDFTGGSLGPPLPASHVFASVAHAGDSFGQARVLSDTYSSLWVLVVNEHTPAGAANSAGYFDVAISTAADPMRPWHTYQFNTATSSTAACSWADFPQIGNDSTAYYITGNSFQCGDDGKLLGAALWDLPKQTFARGRAGPIYRWTGFGNAQHLPLMTLTPAVETGPENTEWLLSSDSGYTVNGRTSSRIVVWGMLNTSAINGGSLPAVIGDPLTLPFPYADPPAARQLGTIGGMLVGDARISSVHFVGGHLFGTFTTAVNWTADLTTRTGVYWVDLLPSASKGAVSARINQANILGFKSGYTFSPSLVVTPSGNLVVVAEASAPAQYIGLIYSSRRPTDPPGYTSRATFLTKGSASYPNTDWPNTTEGSSSQITVANAMPYLWLAGTYTTGGSDSWQTGLWELSAK
ncbi:MAG: serine/threonine protein kinase [Ktedonobacterales bacterium]